MPAPWPSWDVATDQEKLEILKENLSKLTLSHDKLADQFRLVLGRLKKIEEREGDQLRTHPSPQVESPSNQGEDQ